MTRPTPGLTLPVVPATMRNDGDTHAIRVPGLGAVWHVRLIDCWCQETRRGTEQEKALGLKAKEFADKMIADAKERYVHIPLPSEYKSNPLAYLTMERIPGYYWLDDVCLNVALVKAKLASTEKSKPLGT